MRKKLKSSTSWFCTTKIRAITKWNSKELLFILVLRKSATIIQSSEKKIHGLNSMTHEFLPFQLRALKINAMEECGQLTNGEALAQAKMHTCSFTKNRWKAIWQSSSLYQWQIKSNLESYKNKSHTKNSQLSTLKNGTNKFGWTIISLWSKLTSHMTIIAKTLSISSAKCYNCIRVLQTLKLFQRSSLK